MTPLQKLIKDKGLNQSIILAHLGQHKANRGFLKKLYVYPEQCSIGLFVVIANLTGERLDFIIRMAFDVTIKQSPFFCRKDYLTPLILPNITQAKTVTKGMKLAGKKNILYRYIVDNGYATYWMHKALGGVNPKSFKQKGANPNAFKIIDLVKAALITKTNLADVINFIMFQKTTKSLQNNKLFCRKNALIDVPLIIPDSGLHKKKSFIKTLNSTAFYQHLS